MQKKMSDQAKGAVIDVNFGKQRPNEQAFDAAKRLASAGIKVFPCQDNKRPVPGFKWTELATTDILLLHEWFLEEYADTARMVGMPCGLNDIFAIDPDVPKPEKEKDSPDGLRFFDNLCRDAGIYVADAPVINSPSGGKHFIFAQPTDGRRYGNSTGDLPPGIDVRGDGGYLIAVGSSGPFGDYVQDASTPDFIRAFERRKLPQLPDKLAALLKERADVGEDFTPEPMDTDLLREAVRAIPNDEHFAARAPYIDMLHAIWGASGGSPEGKDIWVEWCEQAPQEKDDPGTKYDEIKRSKRGAGFIHTQLQAVGQVDLSLYISRKAFDNLSDDGDPDPVIKEVEEAQKAAAAFTMGRFIRIDPRTIPVRDFIYGWHYVRKFLSATVAPGGIGKSSLVLAEAVSIAIGRDLLESGAKDEQPIKDPARVYYWNGEDPRDEIDRRLYALFQAHNVTEREFDLLAENFFFDSGRDNQIKIATQNRDGIKIAEPKVNAILQEVIANKIDAIIVDPFIASHAVAESDNPAIETVAAVWRGIAEKGNCAVELVHHVRKTNGNEVTVEDSRGASSLHAACRAMRALNRMTEADANSAGVEQRWRFFSLGSPDTDKASMRPPQLRRWVEIEGVELPNGEFGKGDNVGVPKAFIWVPAIDAMGAADMETVIAELREKDYGADTQSSDWAGNVVANVLGLVVGDKNDRRRIVEILKDLERQNVIERTDAKHPTRSKMRKVFKPIV